MRCHQILSVAVYVELTEFLHNSFEKTIFKQHFNFFEIFKDNMVKHPERVMSMRFFSPDILILRAKIMKILLVKYLRVVGSRFEALGGLGSKS